MMVLCEQSSSWPSRWHAIIACQHTAPFPALDARDGGHSGQALCGDAQRAITRRAVRGGGATLTPFEGTGRLSTLDLNVSCADHGFQDILLTFFMKTITFLHTLMLRVSTQNSSWHLRL